MKIVDKAVKKVYRFNCPNCQSRLEGESKEFEDIGGKISKFFCPVCKKDRYITYGIIFIILGALTIPIEWDATFFLFALMVGIMLFASRENCIMD